MNLENEHHIKPNCLLKHIEQFRLNISAVIVPLEMSAVGNIYIFLSLITVIDGFSLVNKNRCSSFQTYILWLCRSVFGSHFGLFDGGQIGSSYGQQQASAKKIDKPPPLIRKTTNMQYQKKSKIFRGSSASYCVFLLLLCRDKCD